MPFEYSRTVRFSETDAAGVVYFANVLTLCHEAYEASLAAASVDLKAFFRPQDVVVPVAHASVDFRRPLFCGDAIAITLSPSQTGPSTYDISYQIHSAQSGNCAAALTRHVCIDAATRQRSPLTPELTCWLSHWSASPAPADG